MTAMCVAAANYIIEKTNKYNEGKPLVDQISMTCKRLQKLLYFSEVEYMKANGGKQMFSDDFYAWPSGPVIPSVYYQFMQYQTGNMEPVSGNHTPLDSDMMKVIDNVFEHTKNKGTSELVKESHVLGGPWSHAFNVNDPEHKQIISKEEMYEFYKHQNVV